MNSGKVADVLRRRNDIPSDRIHFEIMESGLRTTLIGNLEFVFENHRDIDDHLNGGVVYILLFVVIGDKFVSVDMNDFSGGQMTLRLGSGLDGGLIDEWLIFEIDNEDDFDEFMVSVYGWVDSLVDESLNKK